MVFIPSSIRCHIDVDRFQDTPVIFLLTFSIITSSTGSPLLSVSDVFSLDKIENKTVQNVRLVIKILPDVI